MPIKIQDLIISIKHIIGNKLLSILPKQKEMCQQ
jgi:hypothetical protein